MLARLIQSYGKGAPPSGIESQNEEQHTRHLLYPNYNHSDFSTSPPTTPIGSPPTRTTPFDDKGGLELNQARDLRIIVAQDACGTVDRPLVLFDSLQSDEQDMHPAQVFTHHRQPTAPTDRRPSQDLNMFGPSRNRSFTISGPSESWSRAAKDGDGTDRLTQLLDCMFGVTNSAKVGSTTKMHVLMANQSPEPPSRYADPVSPTQPSRGRAALSRTRTSSQFATVQRPKLAERDSYSHHDVVLVTRMFAVNLSASTEVRGGSNKETANIQKVQEVVGSPIEGPRGAEQFVIKKQKLVEKKTPMFAIGLVFLLPRAAETKQAAYQARPASRASHALISPPNSFGSGKMSSWSFVDAIPEALSPLRSTAQHTDWRVEAIVDNWDVVLRSLSTVEDVARGKIISLLQDIDAALTKSGASIPKGPKEQRTNQRTIVIRTPHVLADVDSVRDCTEHTINRICYALRIPRAANGLNFLEGHWLDEARYLNRVCHNKQSNPFVPILLTAFLGSHTQWIGRVNGEGRSRRTAETRRRRQEAERHLTRTVIVSDQRSLARRFVFLLASFLPSFSVHGNGNSSQTSSSFGAPNRGRLDSTPRTTMTGHESLRRIARRQATRDLAAFTQAGGVALSTSASSAESLSSRRASSRQRAQNVRKASDAGSLRGPMMLALPEARDSLRKASAVNSALASNPSTPLAHITMAGDSYFPEDAVGSGSDSIASADLARILRRDSSSISRPSGPTTSWVSLLSNVGGLLGRKRDSTEQNDSAQLPERRRSSVATNPETGFTKTSTERKSSAQLGPEVLLKPSQGDAIESPHAGESANPAADVGLDPPRLHVDSNDGVVDVDVNLPGFLGWATSTGAWSSPELSGLASSIASADGAPSTHSFRPYSTSHDRDSASEIGNIAGYLKRYHEDFSIQAVRDYPELMDDIEKSMLSEKLPLVNPAGDEDNASMESEWIDVSKTVVADLRDLTVRRLVLQTRRASVLPHFNDLSANDKPPTETISTPTIENGSTKNTTKKPDRRILEETITNSDTTLAEAVERILGHPGVVDELSTSLRSTHIRSTSNGTTSSAFTTPPNSSTFPRYRHSSQMSQIARDDIRQAIIGALMDVVSSVGDELHSMDSGRSIQTGQIETFPSNGSKGVESNVLRNGVKRWLIQHESRKVG